MDIKYRGTGLPAFDKNVKSSMKVRMAREL